MAKAERLKKRRWKLWLSMGGLAAVLLVAIAALVTAPIFTSTSIHHPDVGLGPTTLEERIIAADVIARVKLRSVAKTTEQLGKFGELKDVDALEYTFDALEYLKGSGGSQLKAVATDDGGWYDDLREEGVILGFESHRHDVDFLEERDTRWDDRDAIVFLQKRADMPSTKHADRYRLGSLSYIGLIEYTIASRINRHWLPTAVAPTPMAAGGGSGASAAPSGGDQRFLLEEPEEAVVRAQATAIAGGGGDVAEQPESETIALSDLKALIASVESEIAVGESSTTAENYAALKRRVGSGWLYRGAGSNTKYTMEEYKECVRLKYEWRRIVDVMLGGYDTFEGSAFQGVYEVELDSGMAAGVKEIFFWPHFATPGRPTEANIGMNRGGEWIGGRDGELFVGKLAGVRTARPLPEGEYQLYFDVAGFPDILCDGEPEAQKKRTKIIVTVTAPWGTLHELFFDPVTDGSAVAADGTNGVLNPPAITDTNGASATISRVSYESSTVKMTLSPHNGLAGHIVDIIELDGTVSLSLEVFDATVDAANDTLSWSVSEQPWHDGDKLMVRIRKAP